MPVTFMSSLKPTRGSRAKLAYEPRLEVMIIHDAETFPGLVITCPLTEKRSETIGYSRFRGGRMRS
jgi:hypothetical protein